jgi:hypothetical protein
MRQSHSINTNQKCTVALEILILGYILRIKLKKYINKKCYNYSSAQIKYKTKK